MMHGKEKSDSPIVPGKPANKADPPVAESVAEPVEGRGGAKGNADQQSRGRAQSRVTLSPALERVREVADGDGKLRFTSLLHHVNADLLRQSYYALKRKAAPGVDGTTWQDYGRDLESNLEDLHGRVHRGAYRALPGRRTYIPKADGRRRALAIAALEDKIVQWAVVTVLNQIYEVDFLGFSYGFRPGRGQHDALDALATGITERKVNWILDADISGFFDSLSQDWLIRFVEHRIADRRIVRLIRKWLKAGILEEGLITVPEQGTPQGSVISPLLSNVYLHYVLDLWARQWRKREARGEVVIVRYADDFVVGFQYQDDAKRFRAALEERLAAFALSLHPDKTRLIAFGRFAAERRAERGLGKPETFNFLGFTHICAKSKKGKFQLRRKTRRKPLKAKLKEIKQELLRRRHEPVAEQGRWLAQVVRGYFAYHAVPTNRPALAAFRRDVKRSWLHALRRRSQNDRTTWAKFAKLAEYWLPKVRILHPWPTVRFYVKHPRQEPGALAAHAGICAGGRG
jgi:group II intron reverse transcriptase/maturase